MKAVNKILKKKCDKIPNALEKHTHTSHNCTQDEIKSRLNLGADLHYFVQELLSLILISKTINTTLHRTTILHVVLYGCKTWSLTLTVEGS